LSSTTTHSEQKSYHSDWFLVNVGFIALSVTLITIYTAVVEQNVEERFLQFPDTTLEDMLNPLMFVFNPHYYIYMIWKTYILILNCFYTLFFNNFLAFDYALIKLDAQIQNLFPVKYYYFLLRMEDEGVHYDLVNQWNFLFSKFSTHFYLVVEGAWYLKFGYLFFLTTVSSLFCLSYLGLYGAFLVNLPPLFLFWASSLYFLKNAFYFHKSYIISFGRWFNFNINQKINFELYIDYISLSFTVLTLTIALFVYIYCFSYFRAEPNVERLLLFINLFVISMVLLVSSGNFVVLYLGWELIGLTSFFLINFWSTRIGTLKAAFKAFVFNKFSDVSILISAILCYILINDFSIVTFNNEIAFYINYYVNILGFQVSYVELMSFFLIFAAFIKSAQFGTHIWLPDSMEAPVPASALIHSATLVSAGVFLLLRFSPLFELSSYAYYIIPVIGSFTAFFGGICAAYQSDIKRILAYSTISHCGFLMVSFSTHIVEYTLLYLYIHGFFKAVVFLCVGNVIRFSRNYQDFRKMGGYYKYLPLEAVISLLCLVNLSGLPFTLGFYIKHLLLLGLPDSINMFIYLNIIGGALSGIIYSFRLYYYVFFDTKKAKKIIYIQANRAMLKSRYYSNTTLASNIAITGLLIFSYIISIYYFSICINTIENKSELVHFSFTSANLSDYYYPTLSFLKNTSYTNWFILYTILLVYLIKWRYTYNYVFTDILIYLIILINIA
jgi:NADH:ubiquinone oxidoreductase subunit 5 (subunit L)/multisubunit Na+/H+ antiporter MnhA subunit